MIVLAIDPSRTTGWATNVASIGWATNVDGLRHEGTAGHVSIDAVVRRRYGWPHPAPQDLLARRLAVAVDWFAQLAASIRPDVVVVERQSRNELLCHLEGVILAVAGRNQSLIIRVWASTWMARAKKNGWQKLPDPEGAEADAKAILAWAIEAHDLNCTRRSKGET